MKKIFTLFAITALVLCSCTEDDSFYPQRVNPGDKISFGGTLDMKNAGKQTRTVYGDRLNGYTEIKWYQNDQVRIYCAKGVDVTSKSVTKCDYTVLDPINSTNNKEDDTNNIKNDKYEATHYTRLGVVDGETEMCWADNATHTFYGVYPASGQLEAAGNADAESEAAAGYLELSEGKLKGYLPNKQTPLGSVKYTSEEIKDSEGNKLYTHYTMQPSMRYAYMVAKTATEPVESVPLTFNPVVTAVEITLVNNSYNVVDGVKHEDVVEGISMLSVTATKPICGEFETTINGEADTNENKLTSTGDAYKTVSVPVEDLDLQFGDKLTFTVFLILDESTNDVNLNTFSVNVLAGLNAKSATLTGNANTNNGIIVEAKRKNFLNNIPLNLGTVSYTVTPDNWLEYVPDTYIDANGDTQNRTVGSLSIPGAGGAASKSIYVANNLVSAQQSLSITDLWAQGIRCFEFGVDRNSSDLGKEKVYCNLVETDKTLDQAINEVAECLLKHPKEFAIVVVTYQEKLVSSWDRQVGTGVLAGTGFTQSFNKWWGAYPQSDDTYTVDGEAKKITVTKGVLSSSTTVEEARGKMFMIGRHTAVGLDGGWFTGISDASYESTTGQFLAILGWGDHADAWYMRGYGTALTANPTSNQKWASIAPSTGTADRTYTVATSEEDAIAPTFVDKTASFEFRMTSAVDDITYSTGKKSDFAYIQDWRRVMPTATLQQQYSIEGLPKQGTGTSGTKYWYNWAPTSSKKWSDVTTALSKAMNDSGDNKYGLYINSLCGFFIDGTIESSYMPRATFQRYYGYYSSGGFLGIGAYTHHTYGLDDKYTDGDFDVIDITNHAGSGLTGNNPNGLPKPADWNAGDGNWGPYSVTGGFAGNIGSYAHWINNLFYNHLLTLQANGTLDGTKGTGIVLMDRVSDDAATDAAGYYIPRIILTNNEFDFTATPSANGLSIAVSTEEINSDNSDDYKFAAPEKR